MRQGLKRGMHTLSCYSPGGGGLSFSWVDQHGTAIGRTVTHKDVKAYLKLKDAEHLREKGYRPVFLRGHWQLLAPVQRTGDDTLEMNGTAYRYTLDTAQTNEELIEQHVNPSDDIHTDSNGNDLVSLATATAALDELRKDTDHRRDTCHEPQWVYRNLTLYTH